MTTDISEINSIIKTVKDICQVIRDNKDSSLPTLIIDVVTDVVPDLIDVIGSLKELPSEISEMDKETVDLVVKQLCDLAVMIIETVVAKVVL